MLRKSVTLLQKRNKKCNRKIGVFGVKMALLSHIWLFFVLFAYFVTLVTLIYHFLYRIKKVYIWSSCETKCNM